MKAKLIFISLFILLFGCSYGQQLVRGTIKPGASANQVEIWLRPSFSSSSTYLFQLVFPIAFPVSASPQPMGITFTMDPDFVTNFGTYTQTVFPMEHNTGNTENYFPISLSRVGAATQNWTAGGEFKVLTVTFNYTPAATTSFQPKLADYQDFGSGGNGGYYVSAGNGTEYLTSNSVDYFYGAPGLSVVGGTASAGYAQIGVAANAGTVSGNTPLCVGSTTTYTSNGDGGGVWSSTNLSVATVNASSGLVTAASAGTTNITYTVGGVSAFKTLTVNAGASSFFNASACGSYTLPWGGVVTSSGDYVHTYQTVNGCDSVVTGHITINNATSSSFNASACGSYTLPWGGSVTSSGAYVHTYIGSNGCDSVVTANVTIRTATSSTTNVSICSNQLPYSWNGNSYASAGTYLVHLTNAAGCDSAATLVLTVNSTLSSSSNVSACGSYTLPWGGVVSVSGDYMHTYTSQGGCDSVVTIHLTINQATSSLFNANACGSYTLPWGTVVTSSGDYVHTYQTVSGCDSVVTGHITINNATSSSFNAPACNSYTLPWGGVVTNSGAYVHTYVGANGCDSVVTANVVINTSTSSTTNISICANQLPYSWNGNSYASAGTYLVHLTNAAGCDSAATLVLSVNSTLSSSSNVSACGSYTLPWGGVVSASGDYTHTYTSQGGCDSVVTIHLIINNGTSSSFNATACGSYTLPWGGVVTSSGDYVHIYQTVNGCDSVVTGHITINNATSSSFAATACNSYTLPWGGAVTNSGAYVHTYVGANGCDSIVTANVTINTSTSSTTNISICANQLPYSWNGNSYASAGTYLVHLTNAAGCDSAATLVLSVNSTLSSSSNVSACGSYTLPWGGVVTTSGDYIHTYTSQGGCDSVVTIHLIINNSTSSSFNTTACGSYALPWGGVVTNSGAYVHTYQTVSGCDSVVTANVTINAATSSTMNVTICANQLPYVWNGNSYNAGGTYVVHLTNAAGCDSAATLVLGVTPLVSAGTVNGGSPLSIGATNTYTSTGTAGGTWSSSDITVATVNSSTGLVTAVSVGTTNITYTVNTGCGSPVSSFKALTVSGVVTISVNCPGNITTTGTSCSKSITTSNPTYSGPVTKLTWVMSGATTLSSGSTGINYVGTKTFNIGVTTVTYTVKDAGGNSNTCSFTVTLKETTKPTISCPGNITQDASNGLCGKSIAVANPVVKDNCLVSSVTWVMSGATTGSSSSTGINYVGTKVFNVGTTTVTYTVKDASDNSATCSFTVKVKDEVKPTLNCPADIITSVTAGCSKSVAVPNPSFSDNCSVNRLVWAMVGATNAISPLNGINYVGTRNFNVGVTEVIYVVTDAAGNFTTSSFTVVVKDNINPVISCPGNITQTAASGKCSKDVSTPNPVFSDNCLIGSVTWKMTGATTGSSSSYGINYVGTKTFKAGTTTVTYTVKDFSGNTSSCSYTVKVNASGNCAANSSQGGGSHPGMSTRLFEVSAFPNPADHYFNLRVKSDSREEVVIVISDLTGRVLQQLKGGADQSFRFGDRLIPGTYMVEVRQGSDRVIRKVVKY